MDSQLPILLSASRFWSIDGAHWTVSPPALLPYEGRRAPPPPLKFCVALQIQVLRAGV